MDRLPYGPNTRAVRRFLQRFAALAEPQWRAAAEALAAVEGTPRYGAADHALATAVDRADRVAERDAVVGPLLQLVRGTAGADEGSAEDGDAEPHPVAAAALGAALALVVRDVLDPRDFDTLYTPFAALVPADEL